MTVGRDGETRGAGARAARRLAVVCVVGLLAGCSVVAGPASVDTFDLTVPEVAAPASRTRMLQVLVPEPVVDRAYDGDRLLVRPRADEIAYYAGAQWSDRLPRLVQSRLVTALERSGRFRAAGRPGQGLAIDRQLVVEIRAFDYLSAERRVEVVLAVKTMDDRTGRVLSTREHRAEAAVEGDGARGVVAGFDDAFGRVVAAIVAEAGR